MRIVDLQIQDIAFGGKGVARENGKAVFVPFTIDGELVSARITREKKHLAEGEVVQVKQPSSDRVEPRCPYFGRCGGCAYQHIDYARQLETKARQVRDVLQRIGKFQDPPMRPIIPSPLQYAYRNRVTVHAEDGVIGYFRRDSHRLIDVEHCPIAADEVNRQLADLRTRKVPDGHYTLRARMDGSLERRTETGSENRGGGSRETSSSASAGELVKPERNNASRHFVQTNDEVANALRDLVVNLVAPDQQLLVDAYCGAGFFAKGLLDKFERIIGIDWDRFAIAAANENASPKETYVSGNVDEQLRRRSLSEIVGTISADRFTLIADPPATGIPVDTRESIHALGPATLIYISCNPATLARDLFDLGRFFEITSVTPLDMFPQTAEIEVVAELHRRG